MKIIYTGVRNSHYNPQEGLSFEHLNFYCSLREMTGLEVIYIPFDRILEVGKERFNQELLSLVIKEKPDLFFCFMYSEELDRNILTQIREYTKTLAWFGDDYWRIWNYSKRWAPYFDWVVTTYIGAEKIYKEAGITNAILSQWGCNEKEYKPVEVTAQDIDVSFVGQRRSGRERVISALETFGVKVECFGSGWKNGRVTHEGMLKVFSRSKISLNLSERKGLLEPSVIARIFLKKSVNKIVPDFHVLENFRAYLHLPVHHIHARPFELAGSGAFIISSYVDGMERYYKPDEEMIFYNTIPELIEKVRYFLGHPDERKKIRTAGYERTLREHTWEKRFKEVFARIGLG